MNNKDVSRRVLWMFIAFAAVLLDSIAKRILVFLAGTHEVDGELEFRSVKAVKLIVNGQLDSFREILPGSFPGGSDGSGVYTGYWLPDAA